MKTVVAKNFSLKPGALQHPVLAQTLGHFLLVHLDLLGHVRAVQTFEGKNDGNLVSGHIVFGQDVDQVLVRTLYFRLYISPLHSPIRCSLSASKSSLTSDLRRCRWFDACHGFFDHQR